jgi:hypothetical protein
MLLSSLLVAVMAVVGADWISEMRSFTVQDFTGGLNLRADAFHLATNESSDLLNVDLDPRGGVSQRCGATNLNASAVGGLSAGGFIPRHLKTWYGTVRQLLLVANNKLFYSTGGDFTDTSVDIDSVTGGGLAGWSDGSNNVVYVACGKPEKSSKWNGTTAALLTASGTGAWQNDLLNPNGTHMPQCEHVANHIDRLWVANTKEDSTEYPDRVRFSHPLFPESWRENDFIDVVGGGTGVTALVPFGSHILVFKPRGVYAVYGYNAETFQVVQVTAELGAVSPQAVAASETDVYFFSWPEGLFKYNGSTVVDMFDKLRPLVNLGELNETLLDGIYVDWFNRRMFLSLPVGEDPVVIWGYDELGKLYDNVGDVYGGRVSAEKPTNTFVWDPTIGKSGAWSRYQSADGFAFVCGEDWVAADGTRLPVVVHPFQPHVLQFKRGFCRDEIDGVLVPYQSYFVTSWYDAGSAPMKKFWRRPEFVLQHQNVAYTLNVDVYEDWNRNQSTRTFPLPVETRQPSDPGTWLTPDLGADIIRGNSLGLAESVQLKIKSDGGFPWGLNAIVFKYNPRGVKP